MRFLEKLLIKLFEFLTDLLFPRQKKPSSNSIYIGQSQSLFDRDKTEEIHISPSEKESHIYIIGATGTGKTTMLERMIRQHILSNEGFALFDVHGDLTEQVIKFMAYIFKDKSESERKIMARKLILIEPFNPERTVSFNPLEVQKNESVYSTVLELVEVFRSRWAEFWGPRTNELMRNALVILAENNLTLAEAPHLLLNNRFRNSLAANIQNEEAKNWIYRYNKLTEPQKTIYRDPSLNKIGEFLGDTSIRYLMGQSKSSFNFRDAIDKRKWIVVNLSKGKMKSNSFLLASLFLCKLQLAALSRSNIPYQQRKPFYIFADEFQSLATQEVSSMETILSESRKYKLFLRMSHQNLFQIERKLLEAILGNTKAILVFRVNHSDAFVLSQELNPSVKESLTKKLTELGVGEAYFKIRGEPHRLVKLPLPEKVEVDSRTIEELRNLSFSYYTRTFEEIEKEIRERREKMGMTKESGRTESKTEEADGW
ncbi:MAG: helicase HerA-like domain-containing protein [Candidatus Omnitrophota bacterium]|jgi:Cdc6-like AAA superfamily ATPase